MRTTAFPRGHRPIPIDAAFNMRMRLVKRGISLLGKRVFWTTDEIWTVGAVDKHGYVALVEFGGDVWVRPDVLSEVPPDAPALKQMKIPQ
jgi:hypothetical protein